MNSAAPAEMLPPPVSFTPATSAEWCLAFAEARNILRRMTAEGGAPRAVELPPLLKVRALKLAFLGQMMGGEVPRSIEYDPAGALASN